MDHSGPPTVEVHKLSKDFGGRRALRGVELCAQEGESLAIFGPNGSGKTTLIKILATILRPTGGSVSVAGLSLPQEALEVRPFKPGEIPWDDLAFRSTREALRDYLATPEGGAAVRPREGRR